MATPGGPLEICFSFDTTYSMTSYVDQVKARLQDMIQRLNSDIPGIKLALCAHGDVYQSEYDNKGDYVTMYKDLTSDVKELCKFIQTATPTEGGDWDECYELVLREVQEKVSWSAAANKVLVMIGDAKPHAVDDEDANKDAIDWKQEAKNLLNKGIRTYGVYCKTPNSGRPDLNFFKELAKLGCGDFLTLTKFDSIFDLMMAICYRENDEGMLHAFEAEVKNRDGPAAGDVRQMFTTLKKSASNASTSSLVAPATTGTSVPRKARRIAPKPSTVKAPRVAKQQGKEVTVKGYRTVLTSRVNMPENKKGVVKKCVKGARLGMQRTTQTSKKNAIKTTPKKRECPVRLRRERVPESNFGLREYHWSPWQPALQSTCCSSTYEKRIKHPGFRIKSLFNGKTKTRALYEFAVQRSFSSSHKYVVYSKISSEFSPKDCWEDHLLNSKSVLSQVDKVLKRKLCVSVRRLVIGQHRWYSNVTDRLKVYDYPWACNEDTGKSREVTAIGETISHEVDMDQA